MGSVLGFEKFEFFNCFFFPVICRLVLLEEGDFFLEQVFWSIPFAYICMFSVTVLYITTFIFCLSLFVWINYFTQKISLSCIKVTCGSKATLAQFIDYRWWLWLCYIWCACFFIKECFNSCKKFQFKSYIFMDCQPVLQVNRILYTSFRGLAKGGIAEYPCTTNIRINQEE